VTLPPVVAPDAPFATLDDAMTMHLEAALTKTGGQIEGEAGAAKLLDINPHTLRARMRKLGVNWKKFRG
jgi:hydrogenase-4 transcriptional activator